MKNLFALLLLFLSFNLAAQNYPLAGSWTGTDTKANETGSLIFDEDGYITIFFNGRAMGGKEFVMNGIKASMTYAVDYSVEPYPLEITISEIDKDVLGKMYGFIQVLSEDSIKVALGQGGQKITGITEENSIVMNRDKE